MFHGLPYFNQPIGSWDVSSVTTMGGMFKSATQFNQSLAGWDVSSVTTMGGMFESATQFNQPLEVWNVAKVVNMREMFRSASAFDHDITGWYTPGLTAEASSAMFAYAIAWMAKFERPSEIHYLRTYGPPSSWRRILTPITDANFNAAIAACLSTNPVDGLCASSEYG